MQWTTLNRSICASVQFWRKCFEEVKGNDISLFKIPQVKRTIAGTDNMLDA